MDATVEAGVGLAGAHSELTAELPSLRPPRLRRRDGGRAAPAAVGRELVRSLPCLARLVYRLIRDPRVARGDKLLLAAAAAYVITPYDLIPDWIPGLGQLDDLLVVTLTLHRLFNRAGSDLLLEHWDGNAEALERFLSVLERATAFLRPIS